MFDRPRNTDRVTTLNDEDESAVVIQPPLNNTLNLSTSSKSPNRCQVLNFHETYGRQSIIVNNRTKTKTSEKPSFDPDKANSDLKIDGLFISNDYGTDSLSKNKSLVKKLNNSQRLIREVDAQVVKPGTAMTETRLCDMGTNGNWL